MSKKSKNVAKPQTETATDAQVVESQLSETVAHPAEQTQPVEAPKPERAKKVREPDPVREQLQALAADADIALKSYKEHAAVVALARTKAKEALDAYRSIQSKRKALRVELEKRILDRLAKKYATEAGK
jgi:hypothetical protein